MQGYKKKWILSLLVLLVFLIASRGNRFVTHSFNFTFQEPLIQILYSYSWFIVPTLILLLLYFPKNNPVNLLGINAGLLKGFMVAILAVLPMLVSSAIIGQFDKSTTVLRMVHVTVFAGFFEEVLYRGFLFGILFRKCKWGFIPAALIGAVIFGLGHLYQGDTLGTAIGVFVATFMGALWFAWLYAEWNFNLWVPIFLHILMNTSWSLFDISENAMGTGYSNIFRVVTIVITIVLTIRYRKQQGTYVVNKSNLLIS